MAKPKIHPNYRLHSVLDICMRWLGVAPIVRFLKLVASSLAGFTVLFLAFIKFAEYVDRETMDAIPIVGLAYEYRVPAVFFLLIVQTVGQLLIFALSFAPMRNNRKLQQALQAALEQHFPVRKDDRYNYRATLFKARWFPWAGQWLGVVSRSGEKFRRTRTIFSIDSNDRRANTGLAGECFWRGSTIMTTINAKIDAELDDPRFAQCKSDYVKATLMADEEFERMNLKSYCFLLTCIKIDGKKWGVLSLDCDDPEAHGSIFRNNSVSDQAPPKPQSPKEKQAAKDKATITEKRMKQSLEHTAQMISMLVQ
jgi:hypothetical protein